jgi:hypothetical protein
MEGIYVMRIRCFSSLESLRIGSLCGLVRCGVVLYGGLGYGDWGVVPGPLVD